MSTIKRVVKNIFSLFTGYFLNQIAGLCVIIYVARKLGPVQFGILAFAAAFVNYFKLLTDFGIVTFAIRDVARDKKLTQGYAGSISLILLLFSTAAFSLLLIITELLHFSQFKSHLIILYGIAFFPNIINLYWIFLAHEKMEYQFLLQTAGSIFYLSWVFLFLQYRSSIIMIPLAYIVSSLIVSLMSLLFFLRLFGKLRLKKDFNYWKIFVISALPLGIAFMAIQIYNYFDTIMLSFMKGDIVVGWYNAAYKIIFVLLSLGTFCIQAIFPIFSQQAKISLSGLDSVFQKSLKFMTIIAIPIAVGGFMFARQFMNLLFGASYANGILAFQILICSVVFAYLGKIYYIGLLSCEKQGIYFRIVLLSAVINLILNFILIPSFSLYGAAIATLITEAICFLMCYLVFQKILKAPIMNYIAKPAIASLAMGIILYLIKSWHLVFSFTFGIIIYFIFLFLIRGITFEEIKKIKVAFLEKNSIQISANF